MMKFDKAKTYQLDTTSEYGVKPEVVKFVVREVTSNVEIVVEFTEDCLFEVNGTWLSTNRAILIVRHENEEWESAGKVPTVNVVGLDAKGQRLLVSRGTIKA